MTDLRAVAAEAAEADQRVDPIMIRHPEGGELHTLAFAVHALATCVVSLADEVERLKLKRTS
jgi:hypothetical protein